ncbi:hypothetical protein JCM14244_14160 [Venenivibrio stagnispumantis]|uniref:Uncharacterized protein n=1 Tax=Venenivibrio stagnispumantis TaxID=407998 RepID=A0AA45WL51_9AQUI|nr:hypothetical protein [Venenivibrio stagnispumantis]MCW4573697.1 hypothetical protein [Venenivibrio stagnispumantis]SMP10020.1 hypothetical protein SAMN06264868_10757 [Venenivibrio stagnispumantis]
MKIYDFIKQDIKKSFENIEIKEEDFSISINLPIKAKLKTNTGKYKLEPISFGNFTENIATNLVSLNKLNLSYIYKQKESLINSIIYIKEIKNLYKLKYLFLLEPKAIIIRQKPNEILYSPDFPIFYTNKDIKEENEANLKIKSKEKLIKGKNIFFDIGYSPYLIIILVPIDKDKLSFNQSYKIFKEILRRSLQVKKPYGKKLRFLFTDLSKYNYAGLREHLKSIDKQNIVTIINLEDVGFGNEEFIIKNKEYFLNGEMIKKIDNILNAIKISPTKNILKDFSYIDDVISTIPFIWFKSQNKVNYINDLFIPDSYILKMAFLIYSIIYKL